MVHVGLEWFYRHRQLGVAVDAPDVAAQLREFWPQMVEEEQIEFRSSGEESALTRQAVALVTTYLQCMTGEPRPLAVETVFEAPIIDPDTGEDLGIPLLGVIDLVTHGDDGPIVADVKTAARGGRPPDTVHEIQLTSYSYLFRHASGSQESALEIRSLVKTKTPRLETHRHPARGGAHFRRFFAVIRAYLDDLNSGRFVFRPGFACQFCEFRDSHCHAWSGDPHSV
jgi:hypothetical protein